MARAIWSGSISFGLINIPVKLYSAVTEKNVRFNQIDTRNGARIRTRKVNAEDGTDVPAESIAKGYEVSKGRYVLVTDDELASLQPRATHTIDLEEFVDLGSIDPIYFDGAYHVAPDDRAGKSYALLVEAMAEAGKVAVARFVMRSKQYVAIMRPRDGRLVLSMMVYEDEINPATEIPEFDQLEDVEITDRELAMAEQLIESLSADWEPDRFHDTYRDEVLDLIHAKDQGQERVIEAIEGPSEDTVIDLMAALEASVAAARTSRQRHPTARDDAASGSDPEGPEGSGGDDGPTEAPADRAGPARPSPARKVGARKVGAKKPSTAKKTSTDKTSTDKTSADKTSADKTSAKKAVAKKSTTAKKAAKPAAARKSA